MVNRIRLAILPKVFPGQILTREEPEIIEDLVEERIGTTHTSGEYSDERVGQKLESVG